jgi:zinc protease
MRSCHHGRGRWIVLLLALAWLPSALAQPRVIGENIETEQLANGLRAIVLPAHDVPVVTVVALVRGGASLEARDQRGLAHITEHMVFQEPVEGTSTGLLPQTIEALGGEIRAETSADSTRYIATVAPDGMPEAMSALGIALGDPTFAPTRLRAELEIMEKELDEVYASPIVALRGAATKAIYGDGPYARSAGGGPDDLPSYSVADVEAFHAAHYVGSNMAVVVVGDVETAEVFAAVEEAFGEIPAGQPQVPAMASPPETPATTLSAPGAEPLVGLVFVAPGMDHPSDVLATDVLLGMLEHGPTSRMRTQLPRALPGIGAVGAGYLTQRLPGHLYLWIDPGQASAENCIGVLKSILADIRDNGVSQDECLKGARSALLMHAIGADTYTSQAESLAFYEAIDSYRFAVEYEDRVLTVVPGDVQDLVARYFDPDHALVVVGGDGP